MNYIKMNRIKIVFELLILIFMIGLIIQAEVKSNIDLYIIALTIPPIILLLGSHILYSQLDKHSKKTYEISYNFNNIRKDLINLGFEHLSPMIYEKNERNFIKRIILVEKKVNEDIIKNLYDEIKVAQKKQKYYRNIVIYIHKDEYNDECELNSSVIILPARYTSGWRSNSYGSYIIKCVVNNNYIHFCSYKNNPIFLEKIKEQVLKSIK